MITNCCTNTDREVKNTIKIRIEVHIAPLAAKPPPLQKLKF